MNNFDRILFRLKEQLGVDSDKEVASMLGMSVKAFSSRKLRDSFPSGKLLDLKYGNPELDLDDTYILTGTRKAAPKTLTIDLQAGGLEEFIERYQALFPSSESSLSDTEWLREHDLLQGNIANEIARQYREQKR